jgi:adenylate kinase
MRLVLLGAPGAGKGTQARKIEEKWDIRQVSTGDMLRQARKAGTELGRKAGEFMDTGRLVPDEVVVGVVSQRLKQADLAKGFILDGFPRTVPQAEALETLGVTIDRVVNLVVKEEELVERLAGRLTCPKCNAMYHRTFSPPKTGGVCDHDGAELIQRADDNEATVLNRLDVYRKQTHPLVEFYGAKGVLVDVDGTGRTADEVFADLSRKLQ